MYYVFNSDECNVKLQPEFIISNFFYIRKMKIYLIRRGVQVVLFPYHPIHN